MQTPTDGLIANYRGPWSVEAYLSATPSLMILAIADDRKSHNSALKRATLDKMEHFVEF
jgi:hypothetical protein